MTDLEKPLDVAGLAKHLGVSEDWVYKAVQRREIPFTRVARRLRFTRAHVEQILAAGEHPARSAPVIALRHPRARRTA
jgi:excisionase family DNA binding protein